MSTQVILHEPRWTDNESNEQLSIRSEMVFNWNKWVLEKQRRVFSNARMNKVYND